jgi:signal transduction histidine kinase
MASIAAVEHDHAGMAPPGHDGAGRYAWVKSLSMKPLAQDTLFAVLLTAASLVGVVTHFHVDIPEGGSDGPGRSLDALGIGLILLQTMPLMWRRRAPVLVLAVTAAALFLFSVLGYFRSLAAFGFLVALYTVAAHRDRRKSVPAGVAAGVVVFLILVTGKEPLEPDALIAACLFVGAAWFLGDGLRIRRGQVVLLEDRATRLEREGEEVTQRAVGEERRVIARELHDVVAHNVSVIVAQAGAAQRIFDTQPVEAQGALGAIEELGREALVEMRRLMGFLRTDTDDEATRSPQPGLNNLEVLVRQVREAGIPVMLKIEGVPQPVPAGLDLSAFRIIQEALTNIVKHAGPARAEVVVRYEEARLEILVADDGTGPNDQPDGPRPRYGHLGMRERVALFRGELRTGPRPGGGYEVAASLPLNGGAS